MALGDGVRRNVAHISQDERDRFRVAIVELVSKHYPDGVSYWRKQDEIHQATHVHGGPAFLPWHRELCNRFELLLREVEPDLSLHYWDWTEDPREASDGADGTVNLFTEAFMGTDNGDVGAPFNGFPPFSRGVATGQPPIATDLEIINSTNGVAENIQWRTFRENIEQNHNTAHGYIGGSIADPDTAFEDPFVFLLHSNVDRLWAMWQMVPGWEWRLDPDRIYGDESHHTRIIEALEPWAGTAEDPVRPWGPPDYQQVVKNSKDLTVVVPPRYDTKSEIVMSGRESSHHDH